MLTVASCAFSPGRFADSHELSELGEWGSGVDGGRRGFPEGGPPRFAVLSFPLHGPVLSRTKVLSPLSRAPHSPETNLGTLTGQAAGPSTLPAFAQLILPVVLRCTVTVLSVQ